jgi:hypothetical protein
MTIPFDTIEVGSTKRNHISNANRKPSFRDLRNLHNRKLNTPHTVKSKNKGRNWKIQNLSLGSKIKQTSRESTSTTVVDTYRTEIFFLFKNWKTMKHLIFQFIKRKTSNNRPRKVYTDSRKRYWPPSTRSSCAIAPPFRL